MPISDYFYIPELGKNQYNIQMIDTYPRSIDPVFPGDVYGKIAKSSNFFDFPSILAGNSQRENQIQQKIDDAFSKTFGIIDDLRDPAGITVQQKRRPEHYDAFESPDETLNTEPEILDESKFDLSEYFVRGIVVIVGFIFLAVGLAMFKSPIKI